MGGGEYVGFNNAVFLSERECADRNYALGFYMREHKCFPEGTNLKECLDYYFQVRRFYTCVFIIFFIKSHYIYIC
jgi:glutaminase